MHWFYVCLVWMVYSTLVMGVVEAYSERRKETVRGAGAALILGGVFAVVLSVVIFWLGPVDPFT